MSAVDAITRALDPLAEPGRTTTRRELAANVAATLCDSGYRIVPVEPTAAMWAAVNVVERGHVSKLVSAEGWRAMLDAAE